VVLEADGDVDRVLGRDAPAAMSVIVEPLLSVEVAIEFDVVAAGMPSPYSIVVPVDSALDVDV
jgi:hypothetical protein